VRGTWRAGFFSGDPGGYRNEGLHMGISFYRGPHWGTWKEACIPWTLKDE